MPSTGSAAELSTAALPELTGLLPPWPGEIVALPSGRVFVRRTPGHTPGLDPAVYVHGLGGAATNWTDLAALLAGRVSGQALDLPGFGESPPPGRGGYAITARVRSVVELIEAGGAPVHLLGNSLGGLVSLIVAATRPELVRTLTLISPAVPGGRLPARSDPLLPLLLVPGLHRIAERRLMQLTPQERARRVIELCFADPSRVPAQRLAEATEEAARRQELTWGQDAMTGSLRGLAAYYLRVGPQGPWRLARSLAVPTLIVWGTEDRLVNSALAPKLSRAITGSRLLVLPGIGHTAQLEDPETTARAVLALLDANPATPTA